ncbi:hypothetical protein BD779DRAFT_1677583 [Infundibulicybe gibba]|nr:hypothetical protein BD779DRAFT_1677583 [Infundibulicybe gibba]
MPTAPELKQQGNAFVKSGSLVEAARCFTQAETADPTDVVYPSNLSAALYEIGDYAASVDAIVRALQILSVNEAQASDPLVQRLSARLAKALCHGARCSVITHPWWSTLQQTSTPLQSSRADLRAVARGGNGTRCWMAMEVTTGMKSAARRKSASLNSQYFEHKSPIGLSKFSKGELKELSFLLAGVEDGSPTCILHPGRRRARIPPLPRSKRDSFQLHITMLDIHPATLARDLCVMLLLDQLLSVGKDGIEKAEVMATIFYTYVAVVMPSYCETRLLSIMKDLIARLADVPPRLPTWMHVNLEAIDPIMKILRFWVGLPSSGFKTSDLLAAHDLKTTNLEESIKNPDISNAVRDAVRHNLDQTRKYTLDTLASGTPEQLAMIDLTPPPRSASAQTKREYEERKKHFVDTMTEESMDDINSDIGKTWKPNWTLFDEIEGVYPQLREFNPFEALVLIREFNTRFNIKGAGRSDEARPLTFYHVADFFQAAANVLATLAGRVTLEFVSGDLIQKLRKMKFNGADPTNSPGASREST